jgi:release factor glutamine methyltransferase
VHAIDISQRALELARQNAQLVGVASRVRFHQGDLLDPVAALRERIDLIAANPPYVSAEEHLTLEPEVRDHEPRLALVPPDGDRFGVYRRLVPQAAAALATGGALLLEVGLGMADEVSRLCRGAALGVERVVPDLQQIPRVVVARR